MEKKLKIFINYENKWVLTDKKYTEVIAAEEQLEDLQKEILRLKIRDAVIMFVPPFDSTLSPICR
jgi:hypothetical protein